MAARSRSQLRWMPTEELQIEFTPSATSEDEVWTTPTSKGSPSARQKALPSPSRVAGAGLRFFPVERHSTGASSRSEPPKFGSEQSKSGGQNGTTDGAIGGSEWMEASGSGSDSSAPDLEDAVGGDPLKFLFDVEQDDESAVASLQDRKDITGTTIRRTRYGTNCLKWCLRRFGSTMAQRRVRQAATVSTTSATADFLLNVVLVLTNAAALIVMVELQDGNPSSSGAIVSYCCTVIMFLDFCMKVVAILNGIIRRNLLWWLCELFLLLVSGVLAPATRYYFKAIGRTDGNGLLWVQTLSGLRMLRIMQYNRLKVHRTWWTLSSTLAHLGNEMAAFLLFGSVIALALGILSTALIGHVFEEDTDPEVSHVASHYFGTVAHSMITAIGSFNSGMNWQNLIVEPFRAGDKLLLSFILFTIFLIAPFSAYNLVLGLFVKEVKRTSTDYDKLKEAKLFRKADAAVSAWSEVLEMLDEDKDDRITMNDLSRYEEIIASLQVKPDSSLSFLVVPDLEDVTKLWEGLFDHEAYLANRREKRKGPTVHAMDMLFAILQLTGVSASQKLIHLPLRQKMFMQELRWQDLEFKKQMKRLHNKMADVEAFLSELENDTNRLARIVDHEIHAKERECKRQRNRMLDITERAKAKAKEVHDFYLHECKSLADGVHSKLEDLHSESQTVAQDYWTAYLWQIALEDKTALRATVRKYFDTDLWPVLSHEMSRLNSNFLSFDPPHDSVWEEEA